MPEIPDPEHPQDTEVGDDPRPPPAYPGWSAEPPSQQPAKQGWAAPGGPGMPGDQPGGPGMPGDQPPGPDGPPGPERPGETFGAAEPEKVPSWGGGPEWSLPTESVKPGVIPLRPLAVGEILDGAVTTIRQNVKTMLGLAAVVAVIVHLIGFGLNAQLISDVNTLEDLPATATLEEVLDAVLPSMAALLVALLFIWLATVLLTGILTVVVGQAVLGHRVTPAEAWARARPRLGSLLLLTFAYVLIVASPVVAATGIGVLLAAAGAGGLGLGLTTLLVLGAAVLAFWLYVRFALALPAIMLETREANGGAQPVGVRGALSRSAALVHGSWWRVLGILLLVTLIVSIVTNVVSFLFGIPFLILFDPADPTGTSMFIALAIAYVGLIVATTITAPFSAAATALLYIDRRIRSEALDISLARAAGVSIPGRSKPPGPPTPPGPSTLTSWQ